MSKLPTELDISLLNSDSNEFVLHCQSIVEIFVTKFIASGMFNKADEEDIKQSINEILITKLPTIRFRYNGKALLQTYIGAIIQNICLDLYHQENRRIDTIPYPEDDQLWSDDPPTKIHFQEELERFRIVIDMFGTTSYKVFLCLKVSYHLVITEEEIEQCFPVIYKKYKKMLKIFTKPYETMSVEQSFELLAAVFNKHENKTNHWDSLRRWTNDKRESVISLLNGNPPVRAHNHDSLKILLEEYSLSRTKFT